MFQFSSTDLASGVDAKYSDDEFDVKSLYMYIYNYIHIYIYISEK